MAAIALPKPISVPTHDKWKLFSQPHLWLDTRPNAFSIDPLMSQTWLTVNLHWDVNQISTFMFFKMYPWRMTSPYEDCLNLGQPLTSILPVKCSWCSHEAIVSHRLLYRHQWSTAVAVPASFEKSSTGFPRTRPRCEIIWKRLQMLL